MGKYKEIGEAEGIGDATFGGAEKFREAERNLRVGDEKTSGIW